MEYRIIGADLREYGPVDLEEIRAGPHLGEDHVLWLREVVGVEDLPEPAHQHQEAHAESPHVHRECIGVVVIGGEDVRKVHLRRRVRRAARCDLVVAPAGTSDLLRQAEVANHQRGIRALCTQQHVFELEVEVRDPELVQAPRAGDHLREEVAS